MSKKIKKVVVVVAVFFLFIFLPLAVASLLKPLFGVKLLKIAFGKNLFLILTEAITCGIFIYLFNKDLQSSWPKFKENWQKNLKLGFKYWLVAVLLMIIANFIITTLFFLDSMAANELNNREILLKFPVFSILAMVFMAPIIEELVFRLNLKGLMKKRTVYCLVSGFLFGFIHVTTDFSSLKDLLYIIPYGLVGSIFAYAYAKTNNIYTSIFMHMGHNAFSVIIIYLSLMIK